MIVTPRPVPCLVGRLLAFLLVVSPTAVWSAEPQAGPPLTIPRASGPIVLDGDLSDAGWQGVEGITQWFETNVGDNVEPQVKTVPRTPAPTWDRSARPRG